MALSGLASEDAVEKEEIAFTKPRLIDESALAATVSPVQARHSKLLNLA